MVVIGSHHYEAPIGFLLWQEFESIDVDGEREMWDSNFA